ncbi:centrosome-associated protein ALMS1 [Taeniopygia guttata]|uniref:centrosome-associated protein ALMS1 n=1 Tax=Taeniopygia guttata TaxID=59729 RepID=UPI003BB9646A
MEHGQQEQEQEQRAQEPWFWLAAEQGSSSWDTKLGLSCARRDLSELPTLEEGLLPSAEASGAAAPASPLAIQESRFSPCLPLLLSPALAETFLQGSQMDFLPLRGIPDVSGASLERSEPPHVHGSALASPSQHSQPVGQADPGAAALSGEPLGSRGDSGDRDTQREAAGPRGRGDPAPPAPEEGLGKGLEQPWSTAGEDGHGCAHSSQDSDGPAAGSELSEGNKESPGQEESSSSSSGNSSYTTARTKFSEKSERGMQQEKVKAVGSGAGAREKLEKGKKVPELGLPINFCDILRKGRAANLGARDVLCAAAAGAGRGALEECGEQLRGSQGALLALRQQQPAGRLGTEGLGPAVPPSQPQEAAPGPGHSPGQAEPTGSRDELTASDCSIERGHRATEISPSFSLGAEGSFSLHLAHPNFQSTPGLFLKKTGKAEGRGGALEIPPDLQASPSCSNEEAPGESPAPGCPGEQQPPQSPVDKTCARLESLELESPCAGRVQSLPSLGFLEKVGARLESLELESPCAGRVQSLPSLGFLEKVGAWNVGQPQQGPDATSSHVPGAVPPAREASSARPRASSCMLPAQKSLGDAEGCAAPACTGTGSLGSLHFPLPELLPAPALSRSQSDNAVSACSSSRARAGGTPGQDSPAPGGSGSSTTPKVAPGSRAEGVRSATRRSSAPGVFVSSVAQLLRKDGSSPAEELQECEEKGNESLSLSIPSGDDIMDILGAISLESLSFPDGPGEPQEALVVPRSCPSAGGNSPIPPGAALETPKKEELNIEERIPVYLRNLGIQQSPGTILAPFVPRGPLRELEFSPWQPRSLQPPLDTPTEGALLPALAMSQASFGSDVSPLSVSLAGGSEAGWEREQELLCPREQELLCPQELCPGSPQELCPGSPREVCPSSPQELCPGSPREVCPSSPRELCPGSPRELCPGSPRLSGERPPSQGPVPGAQLPVAVPGCPARGAAGAEQDVPGRSSGRAPRAGGAPECSSSGSSGQGWAVSAAGSHMDLDRASQSSGVGSESSQGQGGHSLLGPGALRELLARAEGLAASWSRAAGPTAACREPGEDPKGARLGQDQIPELQRRLSWDEAVIQRGEQGQGLGMHPLHPASCQLPWGDALAVSSQRREGLKGMAPEPRTGKSTGRSEPEGCSGVTTGRSQAAPLGLAQSSAGTAPELGHPPALQPLGSVPTSLGGSQGSPCQPGRAAGTRGSEDSSSGDSLSARVRSLLGRLGRSQELGSAPGLFQSSVPEAGSALGVFQSSVPGAGSAPGVFQSSVPGAGSALGVFQSSVPGAASALGTFQSSVPGAGSAPGVFQSSMPGAGSAPGLFQSSVPGAGSALGAFQSSVPGAGSARSRAGSSSSSGDSLAARVRSLLGTASPGIPASRLLRSAEEHESKIRAWVKLKLASQSQERGPDWDEETLPRMEGVEAELLPRTRRPAQAKDPWLCGLGAASEYLRKQEQERVQAASCPRDRGGQLSSTQGQLSSTHGQLSSTHGQLSSTHGQLSSTHGQFSSTHRQFSGTGELLQPSSPPAAPLPRADPWDCSLLQDMQLKPWGAADLQDIHLKPCNTADLQDIHLKPCSAAELQDTQLKSYSAADLQDLQLKPCSTAELQLKPYNAAELQDTQLKPRSTADPQLKPCIAADLQDTQLKPCSAADLQLKPCSTAELQDTQLKPYNAAELQDTQLKPRSTADPQLNTAELQDLQPKPCIAADPQLKPCIAAELQDMQLKPCSTADLQLKPCIAADLQDMQLKPCIAADPQLKPCIAADLQDMQLKPCIAADPQPKPCIAAGPAAPQQAAQQPGSLAGERQSPGTEQPRLVPGAVPEQDTRRAAAGGLSQEVQAAPEPPAPSPPRQQEMPPGHSSESPGAAAHRALLQGPAPAGAQGRKSPQEPPEEAVREQMGAAQPSPADEALSTVPEAPSSPVRRFLSCVHITLSSRAGSGGNRTQLWDKAHGKAQARAVTLTAAPEASVEGVPASPPAEGAPEDPSSAEPVPPAGPSWVFSPRQELQGRARAQLRDWGARGARGTPSSAPAAKAGTRTCDAATQITTEGATKATLSAEICVGPQDGAGPAQLPSLPSAPAAPGTAAPSHREIPPFPRQPAQPLLLPYKPSGSSGMYYVPFQKPGATVSPGEPEASTASSHSGSEEAPAGLLAAVLGVGDDLPAARGTIHAHRPKLAWPEEHSTPREQPPELPDGSRLGVRVPAPLPLRRAMPAGQSCQDPTELSRHGAGAGRAARSSGAAPRRRRGPRAPRGTAGPFFTLAAEADDSRSEEPGAGASFGNGAAGTELPHGAADTELPHGAASTELPHGAVSTELPHGAVSTELPHGAVSTELPHGAAGTELPHGAAGTELPHGAAGTELPHGAAGTELPHGAAGSDPGPHGWPARPDESVGKAPRQRGHARGGLDELWVRFLERQGRQQQQQQQLGGNGELSLVQRLDRLARLLQNPVRHALAAGQKAPEEQSQGRERPGAGLAGTAGSGCGVEPRAALAARRPRVSRGSGSPGRPRAARPGQEVIQQLSRALQEQQRLAMPSDSSPESRLSAEPSSSSAWDTPAGPDTSPASGDSSSVSLSTIDTARLLRAFGQRRLRLARDTDSPSPAPGLAPHTDSPSPASRRVLDTESPSPAPRLAPDTDSPSPAPQLAPGLARLYSAISQQKSRSQKWHEESGGAGAAQSLGKERQSQHAIPFSLESTCASSSSWGPSSALSSKRQARMLNKGIQAGDLEIVSSATRKNTRDVGVTFPTPRSSQQLREPPGRGQGPAWQQPWAQPGTLLMDTRTKRSRLRLQQGTPWLVPAEDLEWEWRKENQCSAAPGPGPAWFEPWSSTKAWREPLREKNREEQPSLARAAAVPTGAGRGLGQPLGKLTLQEALALHRPDFISRSGQRLRHLRLLREERRLHKAQRDQLLPPQRDKLLPPQRDKLLPPQRDKLLPPQQLLQPAGRRKDCRTANHPVSNRGFLMKEKRRAIPKSEMLQRSKRIYEQLPEVRRKREEEQRRQEYSSYRLRAQLYKTEIASRVLGKKVSWS